MKFRIQVLVNTDQSTIDKKITEAEKYISKEHNISNNETQIKDDIDLFGEDELFDEGDELFGDDDELFGESDELFGDDDELFGEGDELFGNDDELFENNDDVLFTNNNKESDNQDEKDKQQEKIEDKPTETEVTDQAKVITLETPPTQKEKEALVTHEWQELNVLRDISEQYIKDELQIFQILSKSVDAQTPSNINKSFLLEQLAHGLNEQAGNLIDKDQLSAAVRLHDIGMLRLDNSFFSQKKISDEEFETLQQHPIVSHKTIAHCQHWKIAAEIILQHHERPDGSGYPNKIKDKDICEGAKLLAVIDAFHSMTTSSSLRKHKRSYLRAAAEINACSGTQFSPTWVAHFNKMLREQS